MNAKEAIAAGLKRSQRFVTWFVEDLSDDDLLVRPAPGANPIAWQLGHLILTEQRMLGRLPEGTVTIPPLPEGFAERHTKETAAAEPPAGFATKAEYVDLFNRTRQATLDALEKLSDADLDRPVEGPIARLASTVGSMLVLAGNHSTLHAGQFSVVRRKLGKPVLF
jgi:hypothetical protein